MAIDVGSGLRHHGTGPRTDQGDISPSVIPLSGARDRLRPPLPPISCRPREGDGDRGRFHGPEIRFTTDAPSR